MSGFTGFQCDHFDYFLLHNDNDARRWVRDQVVEFAIRVQTELHKCVDLFYDASHVGKLEPFKRTAGLLSAPPTGRSARGMSTRRSPSALMAYECS